MGVGQDRFGLLEASPDERASELDLGADALVRLGDPDLERPLEQARDGVAVAERRSPPSGGHEMSGGALTELAATVDQRTELPPIEKGLLEVIAHDLLDLGQAIPYRPDQPARELLVEPRAPLLRRPAVGSLADEDVLEAERELVCEGRHRGTDEVAPLELLETGVERLTRQRTAQRRDGALVEELTLDRTTLERLSRGRVEPIETGADQCVQAHRQRELRRLGDAASVREAQPVVREHRHELLREERVAGRRLREARAKPPRHAEVCEELVDRLLGQRLERHRDGPVGSALEEILPRQADDEDGHILHRPRKVRE